MQDIKNKILTSTNGGKDIIEFLYPQTKNFFGTKKKFRSPLRDGDSTPSASLKEYDGVWYLKDFGINDNGMNGIDLFMKVHSVTFSEALHQIAGIFNIDTETGKCTPLNALYEKRTPCQGQADGTYYETKPFSPSEIKFLSPNATEDVLREMGFESVSRIYYVNGGVEHSFSSRDGYPIYVRTARMIDAEGNVTNTVHKLYQPRYRKGKDGVSRKFQYQEKGKHPDSIVNGLYEIKMARDAGAKSITGIICTGERDAVCIRAAGCYPIWFNGEGHNITDLEMRLIRQFCDVLYYIPDIDDAGKAMAMKNVHKFPELKTIWLPEEMLTKRSDQMKACKDLRDWVEMHPKAADFRHLLNTAHSYKFVATTKNGKVKVSADDMRYMLKMNGFYQYQDPYTKEHCFVRINGQEVRLVKTDDIRSFVISETQGYCKAERDAVLTSNVTTRNLKDLEPIDLDFTDATRQSQTYHCSNASFIITSEGISEIAGKQTAYVWEERVIRHDVELCEPFMEYTRADNSLEVRLAPDCKSKAAMFVERLSRIHWQCIDDGIGLTEQQKKENIRNFTALVYSIGHMLHRYRSMSNAFAPYFFEYDRYDGVEANGGTGKTTLVFTMLPIMGMNVVKIKVGDKDTLEKQFAFQEVTPLTDIVFLDECYKGFRLTQVNDLITGGLQVEKKNRDKFSIPRDKSPQIVMASNYDPDNVDPSVMRRTSLNPVSHYYHHQSPNTNFESTRTIADDFGIELWQNDYPEEDWNRDINFLMQCVSFYLAVNEEGGHRPEAPLSEVLSRINETIAMGNVAKWAKQYYIESSNTLNVEIDKEVLREDFERWCVMNCIKEKISKTAFIRQLKAWIATKPDMEYNPVNKCTSKSDRRIKRSGKDYVYVRKGPEEAIDQTLPF